MKKVCIIYILLMVFANPASSQMLTNTGHSFESNYDTIVLYVGGSGPGNYTKIQDAIDNATDGDTVFVYDYSSPYYENITVDKSIHLVGEKTETTIINGSGLNDVITVTADTVTISNLSIVNSEHAKAGILMTQEASYGEIKNCICKNNYWGIDIQYTSHVTVKNCQIIDNVEGTIIRYSSFCEVSNCSFSNQQSGIWIYYASQNRILNNNISHTNPGPMDIGIYCYSAQNNLIYGCSLVNNGRGIDCYNHSLGNTIEQCIVNDNIGSGICIWNGGSNTLILNSEISHNGYGMDYDQYGVFFDESSYMHIEGCTISENKKTEVESVREIK